MRRTGACLAAVVLGLSPAGCGFLFPTEEPEAEGRFNSGAYRVGNLEGSLADDLDRHLDLVEHNGTSSNGPMIIASDIVDELTSGEAAAVKAAWEAGFPVAVVDADATEVAALRTVLGVTSAAFEFPPGVTHVEIYALDREPDGSTFERVQFAPIEQAAVAGLVLQHNEDGTEETDAVPEGIDAAGDNAEDQSSRAEAFARWLEDDGERIRRPPPLSAEILAQEQASSQNLPDIAKAWVMDVNYQLMGANYQISHFIYSCHEIATGYDWFLVEQWCVFSGKGAMITNANRHKGRYMDKIELDAWVTGYENNPPMVRMMRSSPETANNQTSITSGVSYSLGGEVALDGPKVTGGISIESSETVIVSDCNVYNQSNDRQNNAHWLYEFRRCDASGTWKDHLSNPPALAVTTFQPINQWIWKMAPQVRAARPTISVRFRPQLVDTDMTYYFFAYKLKNTWWWWDIEFKMRFPFPPLTPPQ